MAKKSRIIVRFLLSMTFLVAICGCVKHTTVLRKTGSFVITQPDSVDTFYRCLRFFTSATDRTNYIASLDDHHFKIYLFVESGGTSIQSISLPRISYGRPRNFEIVGQDSLMIHYKDINTFLLLNFKGQILDQWKLADDFRLNGHSYEIDPMRFVVKNGAIYFGCAPGGVQIKEGFYSYPCFAKLELMKNGRYDLHFFLTRPREYQDPTKEYLYDRLILDAGFNTGFAGIWPAKQELLVFSDTSIVESEPFKTRTCRVNKALDVNPQTKTNVFALYQDTSGCLVSFHCDKFRRCYYALYLQSQSEFNSKGLRNYYSDAATTVVVFDHNGRYVSELELDAGKYAPFQSFVTEKGLLIKRKVSETATGNSHVDTFDVFTPSDNEVK